MIYSIKFIRDKNERVKNRRKYAYKLDAKPPKYETQSKLGTSLIRSSLNSNRVQALTTNQRLNDLKNRQLSPRSREKPPTNSSRLTTKTIAFSVVDGESSIQSVDVKSLKSFEKHQTIKLNTSSTQLRDESSKAIGLPLRSNRIYPMKL